MKLIELATGINIKHISKDISELTPFSDIEITDISSDSRCVSKGSLFVCIRGTKVDGHNFIKEAARNGASVVLLEEGASCEDIEGVLYLVTKNTRLALAHLWNNWFRRPADNMKLVAVTGTNGKTSVTFMLRSIFRAALVKTGIIGTVTCYSDDKRLEIRSSDETANMTTPDPKELYAMLAAMRDDGVETVFIEATSHALALDKLAPLHFAASVFTNLTPDHLDFHGNMENYLAAKKKLFSMTDIAVINADDTYAEDILMASEAAGCKKIKLCTSDDMLRGDYSAVNIRLLGTEGSEYMLSSVCAVFKVKSRIPGRFTVMNSLEAAACALEMGVSPKTVQDALYHMDGIGGRFESVKLCTGAEFSVFIDYAHTPDALRNLLRSVRDFRRAGQRIVLLFGCGGDRDKSKRAVMGKIASELADFVVVTSDNSRSEDPRDIISDIMVGFDYTRAHAVIIENRAEAIDYVIKNALRSDIILLAGKGHEEYEIDAEGKHPFSEKNIVEESARKYYYYK